MPEPSKKVTDTSGGGTKIEEFVSGWSMERSIGRGGGTSVLRVMRRPEACGRTNYKAASERRVIMDG